MNIRRYSISGSRRLSNFVWTSILFLGSSGFLFAGFYSDVQFFPQGLVMIFYGFLGFFLSLYLGLTLFWSLGSGFNEFNKRDAYIRIFRWGFPGKNRRMNFYYSWEDVLGLRVAPGFLTSQYTLFLQIRGKGVLKEIPLTYTYIGEESFEEMEKQASALAKFLQVSLTLNMQQKL